MLEDDAAPGVIVHHVAARTGRYVGSPAFAVLPDGRYVASHDHFGPGCRRDQTFIYQSTDRGASWQQIAELTGQWWSSLFTHEGALYLFGTTTEYGHCVIRRSTDGGVTWTTPEGPATGLLRSGRHHTTPGPVLVAKGRIWRAMEDAQAPGNWGEMFRAFMMSAPVDADLLDAGQWQATPPMESRHTWLWGDFGGWLEGNAVQTPDGEIVNVLRVDSFADGTEKAAIMHIGDDGLSATFDPDCDVIPFPGGSKKFTIRYDVPSGRYLSLVNDVPTPQLDGIGVRARNTLSLVSSLDLRHWTRHTTLLHHPDDRLHGFQYVDWLTEDEDLLFLSRTAHGTGEAAAHSHHDANYLTFHRVPGFRKHMPNGSNE
ncbi:sialidase family protein [Nonomuraea sp. NPDC005983]|uniref:sialidase family protein n=1 Tax=Nonomuraea sp. NPDC005983 TaxID=3155595 RepID=UPI0033B2F750